MARHKYSFSNLTRQGRCRVSDLLREYIECNGLELIEGVTQEGVDYFFYANSNLAVVMIETSKASVRGNGRIDISARDLVRTVNSLRSEGLMDYAKSLKDKSFKRAEQRQAPSSAMPNAL